MIEISKRKRNLDMGIITLWIHWAMATSALAFPILLGYFMPLKWLPLIIFLEVFGLYYYIRSSSATAPRCYLIMNICGRALICSGLIMVVINLAFSTGAIHAFYDADTLNHEIPFIPTLIISPAACFFAVTASVRRSRQSFCQSCIIRFGSAAERGFIGAIYKQEGQRQSELLAWLTGIVSIFDWGYYLLCYINVNFNRADTFFLVVIPVGFYVLTLIYTALRYSGLLAYYSREAVGAARARGSITQLRFLVVHDNSIYLGPDDPEQSHPRLDTPYSLTIHYCKDIPIELVKDHFCNLAQAQDATIKYIYTSESGNLDGTIRHYIATIGNKTDIDGTLYPDGRWNTFYQLKQMINARKLAPLLRAELVRIYTTVMTWKTYDSNGKRLYKIKSYRPTFHLKQLPDWDVDFDDNRWLFIAANNEDMRFFKLRRFIKQLFFGRKI